jgi:hypothetical protein
MTPTYPASAIWHGPNHDEQVVVTGDYGEANGRKYFQIEGSTKRIHQYAPRRMDCSSRPQRFSLHTDLRRTLPRYQCWLLIMTMSMIWSRN